MLISLRAQGLAGLVSALILLFLNLLASISHCCIVFRALWRLQTIIVECVLVSDSYIIGYEHVCICHFSHSSTLVLFCCLKQVSRTLLVLLIISTMMVWHDKVMALTMLIHILILFAALDLCGLLMYWHTCLRMSARHSYSSQPDVHHCLQVVWQICTLGWL